MIWIRVAQSPIWLFISGRIHKTLWSSLSFLFSFFPIPCSLIVLVLVRRSTWKNLPRLFKQSPINSTRPEQPLSWIVGLHVYFPAGTHIMLWFREGKSKALKCHGLPHPCRSHNCKLCGLLKLLMSIGGDVDLHTMTFVRVFEIHRTLNVCVKHFYYYKNCSNLVSSFMFIFDVLSSKFFSNSTQFVTIFSFKEWNS